MTITLEAIEAQQTRIAEMIAAFKVQPRPTERHVDAVTIPLAAGEEFAGLVLGHDGEPDYYLILLPGEKESINFDDARQWATDLGATLPTRREQSILFANLKDKFEAEYYWSGEQHESNSGYAWFQTFDTGLQTFTDKSYKLRAVAVRRFIPSVI
ncbi:Lcl C-terminal domain-containing protein [Paraburkholderia sp. 2C]